MFLPAEVTFYAGARKGLPAGGYRPDALFCGEEESWGITFAGLLAEEFDVPALAAVPSPFRTGIMAKLRRGRPLPSWKAPAGWARGKFSR